MGKTLRVGGRVIALAVLVFLTGDCDKKATQTSRIPPPAGIEIKGDLSILHASPSGQLQTALEADEIVVIFDHPMAALEPLPLKENTDFLKFDPSLSGTYQWLGTRTLSFKPKGRWPWASEFRVSIPAGTVSLDGYSLKKDYSWTFVTARPRLIRHFPEAKQKQQKLETEVLLIFNQPMDPERAREDIAFYGVGPERSEHKVDFEIGPALPARLADAEMNIPPANCLFLKPVQKLKPGFAYTVELKAGLPGRDGRLGMEKNEFFNFETFKPFRFVALDQSEGHVPDEPLLFRFSNSVSYKDFVAKIRFEPQLEIPDYYAEWDLAHPELWLTLPLKPDTAYTAAISSDLNDAFGNRLGQEVKVAFSTASSKPFVRMTTGHGVLEAYGDLTYPLSAVNTTQLQLQAARLNKDAVIPVLESEKIFWSSERYAPGGGFFQVDRPLNLNLPKNEQRLVPLNIRELSGEPYGFLLVQLDNPAAEKWDRYPKAFLQVTELGISGKFSPENNVIWVTELRTGKPVAGAEVEIRDETNAVRWKGKTDADGKAQSPGWKVLGIASKSTWDKPKQWVFARRGSDIALTSSEWGSGLDPYRFDIAYEWSPEPQRVEGSVFSERGIYRAGETVHLKGIFRKREKGEWRLPAVARVACEVLDSFEKTALKSQPELDSFGSFSCDFETRPDASLGTYTVKVKIPPETPADKETSISGSFRVEAFRPAEFEVHLRTLKDSYIFGDPFQAEIRGAYLFGGAMTGQKTRWTLRLNPTTFAPPGFKGFVFGDEIDSRSDSEDMSERSRLIASGEGTLGPDGKMAVKVPLVPEKEKSTVSAALEATIQSPSLRSVSNRIQAIVHQGEFYIGLKPASSFLKKGDKISVDVVAAAPGGSPIPDKKVSIRLVKREWRSVRKADAGGGFRWISENVDTDTEAIGVRTKNEPLAIAFQPQKSGFYLIAATSQDARKNTISTTTYVYVTGQDYIPWERSDDDFLELIADKAGYHPGEKARILVKSPYERAKAMVTIEREFILRTEIIDLIGSASEIEIPITQDHIPNVFISILLVQGRTSGPAAGMEDVGKPSFKLGYVNLNVDPSEKRLSVNLAPEKKIYKPKDRVKVRIKVQDAKNNGALASVALAAVDLGVLNVIGYQTPDPFSLFYGEKPLSVQTSETRLHVVGQRSFGEKGENIGGGGVEMAAAPGGLTEVELRGDFKSTAYWNPSILTDDKGEATVEFSLPDNLTTFRLMAVVQTKDSRFGRAEENIKVSKPLLILPSLPRFARVGDEFQAGVVLHNNSDKKGTVAVAYEAKGIRLSGAADGRDSAIGPGEAKEFLYSLKAETPGKAVFAFRAKMGEASDGLELTIPVVLPRPTETVATAGQVTGRAAEEYVTIPEIITASENKIEVQAAASALAGLSGSVDYLTNYPYLCLEQRLSSILPYLVAPKIIRDFKLSSLSPTEIRDKVQRSLKEVYACQKPSGGFGLWPDSPFESPYISCYAVFALQKAQAAGYAVNDQALSNGLVYSRNLLRVKLDPTFPYDRRSWATTQAFALYLLALAGQPEAAYAEKLFLDRESLSLFGRAHLLKALFLGSADRGAFAILLRELLNKAKITAADAHFEEEDESGLRWIYSSNTRTTAIIVQTLVETGSPSPLLQAAAKWLVEKQKAGRWSSTQENFFVFYALNDFYKTMEKGKPEFKAEITLARKTLLDEQFRDASRTVLRSWPLAEWNPGQSLPLRIVKTGAGTLYYNVRMTYGPRGRLDPRDEGIAVYKKIESLEGRPLDAVKAGSLAVVTLVFAVPKESLFVVVEDPLPAGFETVNPNFLTESQEQLRALDELGRSDAKPWWEGFNHIEMHDDRVLLFSDSLRAGIHTHRYLVRALTSGRFTLPGTKAMQMYAPEVFGRSAERIVSIVK